MPGKGYRSKYPVQSHILHAMVKGIEDRRIPGVDFSKGREHYRIVVPFFIQFFPVEILVLRVNLETDF